MSAGGNFDLYRLVKNRPHASTLLSMTGRLQWVARPDRTSALREKRLVLGIYGLGADEALKVVKDGKPAVADVVCAMRP
jgi:hypothetical protein